MTEFSHFRDSNLADTVVIDKINIFRADRVFKVFCLSHGCLFYDFNAFIFVGIEPGSKYQQDWRTQLLSWESGKIW